MRRGIFISYRDTDTRGYATLLYSELSRTFGPRHIFLDTESILAGDDFTKALVDRVRNAQVLLVLIGSRWLDDVRSGDQTRPIDDPNDWIRRELIEAFATDTRVIPVLVDQGRMPAPGDLPEEIAALAQCQYRRLHRGAATDVRRIIKELRTITGLRSPHLMRRLLRA